MTQNVSLETLAHRVASLEAAMVKMQERQKEWQQVINRIAEQERNEPAEEAGRKICEADHAAGRNRAIS